MNEPQKAPGMRWQLWLVVAQVLLLAAGVRGIYRNLRLQACKTSF